MRRKFLSSQQFRSVRRALPLAALALAAGGCLLPPDAAKRGDGAAADDLSQRLPAKPAVGANGLRVIPGVEDLQEDPLGPAVVVRVDGLD